MNLLSDHGVIDAILAVFLFLLAIITGSLRTAINEFRKDNKELSKAIQELSITISREYMPRNESEKANEQIWDRIDRQADQISGLNSRIGKMER